MIRNRIIKELKYFQAGMDLSRSCRGGGGGAQVRCCISHVHRPSPHGGWSHRSRHICQSKLLKLLYHSLFPIFFGLFMKNSTPLAPPLAKAWGGAPPCTTPGNPSLFPSIGPAVRIIQDGKSPVRSDAYFPEWKPALSVIITVLKYSW